MQAQAGHRRHKPQQSQFVQVMFRLPAPLAAEFKKSAEDDARTISGLMRSLVLRHLKDRARPQLQETQPSS
jgi:hypothetical protein